MEFVIEPNLTYNFKKVYCSEGHYITKWNDGDDICDFQGARLMYCPMDTDVESIYHCISDEEFERLNALKEEALYPTIPDIPEDTETPEE